MIHVYIPNPKIIEHIRLPDKLNDLVEKLAENTHDQWALGRINEGWTYGPERNDIKKTHPCLVPYADLPDSEKEYDRRTSLETLKFVISEDFSLVPNDRKKVSDTESSCQSFLLISDDDVERLKLVIHYIPECFEKSIVRILCISDEKIITSSTKQNLDIERMSFEETISFLPKVKLKRKGDILFVSNDIYSKLQNSFLEMKINVCILPQL